MLKTWIFILPEFYYCLFIFLFLSKEFLLTTTKSIYQYKKNLIYVSLNFLLLSFIYLFTLRYLIYIDNDFIYISNNYYIFKTSVVLKSFLTFISYILINIKIKKLNDAINSQFYTDLRLKGQLYNRYLFIFLISYLSLISLLLTSNFISFFICIELIGLTSIILITEPEFYYNFKNRLPNIGSAFSYFFIHVIGSVILLLSIFLLALSEGSLMFEHLALLFSESLFNNSYNFILNCGIIGLFTGLLIKMGISPFYFWIIKAYQNINLFNMAYFLLIIKMYMILVLYQFLLLIPELINYLLVFFSIIALSNLISGPFVTLNQLTLKRFLIGSSITNAGYIFTCFCLNDFITSNLNMFLFIFIYVLTMTYFFLIESLYIMNVQPEYTLNDFIKLPSMYRMQLVISLFLLMSFPPSINFIIKARILQTLFNENSLLSILILNFSILGMLYYLYLIVDLLKSSYYFIFTKYENSFLDINSFLNLNLSYRYLIGFLLSYLSILSIYNLFKITAYLYIL